VADGSIMATIMTDHIANVSANSAPLKGWSLEVITMLIPVETIRIPAMSMPPMSMSAASRKT
jgi:hypothetical protein